MRVHLSACASFCLRALSVVHALCVHAYHRCVDEYVNVLCMCACMSCVFVSWVRESAYMLARDIHEYISYTHACLRAYMRHPSPVTRHQSPVTKYPVAKIIVPVPAIAVVL